MIRRHTQRANYWSHSKLAKWIKAKAGFEDRTSGTMEQHKEWRDKHRAEHPVVYWITEEGFGIAQNFVNFIPDYAQAYRNYLLNRFVYKMHTLPTSLDKGEWVEYDYRLLYGMFGLLTEYVEVDCALMSEHANRNRWLELLLLKQWRSAPLGVAVLIDEAVEHNQIEQGKFAKEILDLYMWWTVRRPKRIDPYAVEDSSKYEKMDIFDMWADMDKTPRDYKAIRELTESYEKEDTEMMERLVKVRKKLWN